MKFISSEFAHHSLRAAVFALVFVLVLPCKGSGAPQTPKQQTHGAPSGSCLDNTAKQLLEKDDFKNAIIPLRAALRQDSNCADAQYMLAYSLLRDNRPDESLSTYTAAARMRTPSATDLRNVALDYVLLEDYADARHWVKAALSIDAQDAESWYVLGRIQYTTSDAQGAASSFERSLELTPHNSKVENNLGLAYEALNEPSKAIEAYHQAIVAGQQSGRPSEQPLMNLAILLSHKGDLQTALSLLISAVAIAPQDVDVQEHLGHTYLDLNELPEAQAHLEKAVALHPSDGRLHFLLGQAYRRSGMTNQSKAEFALAASLDATHATPLHVR
jgi:Tfp pilus assembly protein PilF